MLARRGTSGGDAVGLRGTEIGELLEHYGRPIQPLLDDPDLTEIMVNDFRDIWVEREGRLIRTDAAWDDEHDLINFIRQIANSLDQEVDDENPMLDARLPDNTRINATLRPISLRGAVMSIRPFPKKVFRIEDLVARGAIPERAVALLRLAVLNRLNMMIVGGTGSGKTTVLRCVCQMIPHDERVCTAEDTAENLLPDHPHVVPFEVPRPRRRRDRGAHAKPITMADLIIDILRKRPDRPIVGEIRTPEACAALVDAVNTGHGGMVSTMHANGTEDAFDRMDLLFARQAQNVGFEAIRRLTRRNIDVVAYVARDRALDGTVTRRLKEIAWVDGMELRPLCRHTRRDGHVFGDGNIARFEEELALA